MLGHQGGHNGQTKAGAAGFTVAGGIGPVEAFKHPCGVVLGDAGTMVAHFQHGIHAVVDHRCHADGHLNGGALRGVPQRIGHQVGHDLPQPCLVSHGGGALRSVAVQPDHPDLPVRRAGPGVHRGVVAQDHQVNRFILQRPLLIHPGQRQQVFHQLAHAFGLGLDAPHGGAHLFGLLQGAVPVQLGEAADGHQRSPQLV